MEFNIEAIKKHPYATGAIVIVGGGALFLIMRSRNSAPVSDGSGYGYDTQSQLEFAQINAASEAAMNQTQGQIQIAQLNAGVANSQVQAQLEAYKVQGQTTVQLAQIAATSEDKKTEMQSMIYKTLFETARDETISNNELSKYAIQRQYDLAQSGVELAKRENRGKEGTNVVGLALNQGNIGSYNQSVAAEHIASSMATASIIGNIAGAAGGILGGL